MDTRMECDISGAAILLFPRSLLYRAIASTAPHRWLLSLSPLRLPLLLTLSPVGTVFMTVRCGTARRGGGGVENDDDDGDH